MPKSEHLKPTQTVLLHDHLDGSYPLMAVLPELFRLSGKEYPFRGNLKEQHAAVKAIFANPQIDIVERFSNTTGVMQSRETLTLAAEAYTRVRAEQGFLYCEATVAPQYHTFAGLKEQEVVAALIEGIKRGEERYPEIEVNLLFTVGREVAPEEGMRLAECAAECDRNYVVGIGLVCDEAAHPPEKHISMFKRAKELGFKTTAHAGEWVNVPPAEPDPERDRDKLLKNIATAVMDLGVNRVGHAIPLAYSMDLMKLVEQWKIGVELCPGSNLTSGLIPNTGYIRIRELLQAGVLCSINPDDDLFLPDYFETMELCNKEYAFTAAELEEFNRNAWLTRFGKRKHKLPTIWD